MQDGTHTRDPWEETLAENGYVSFDMLRTCRGGGKTAFYAQQARQMRYKNDPHDMELLEEIK